MDLDRLQRHCQAFLAETMSGDPAHDISHVQRVVQNTLRLTEAEDGDPAVTVPAAWLHDCVTVAKDSPLRKKASSLAADEAVTFLRSIGHDESLLPAIHHAIAAHSFSANIPCETLEAGIVQDADRLEAIGAIGIARCFLTGGAMGTPLYDPSEPFAENRELDDKRYTLDHFHVKLFKLASTMQTDAGRAEALQRTEYMREYLRKLAEEIGVSIQE
jgi:uncharacterized protein